MLYHRTRNDERLQRVRCERNDGVAQSVPARGDESRIGRPFLVAGSAQDRDADAARRSAYLLRDRKAARLGRLAEVGAIADRNRWMVPFGWPEGQDSDQTRHRRVRLCPERQIRPERMAGD